MAQQISGLKADTVNLYTTAKVRAIDAYAINKLGINSYGLMRRAAEAALAALLTKWPATKNIVCFCGVGNNGGDGYVLAALARQQGLDVRIVVIGDLAKLSGDALTAYDWAVSGGVMFTKANQLVYGDNTIIVDAMLGTGQRAAPRDYVCDAIAEINRQAASVAALDIPTGLCADTGKVLGEQAIKADLTVTFIGLKQGLLTHQAVDYVGEIVLTDLNVPAQALASEPAECQLFTETAYSKALAPRQASSHKGLNGHVLIIGGNLGFGGAALLAASAALRAGAGLVSVATKAGNVSAYLSRQPELMVRAVDNAKDLEPLLANASVIVVGPGLGQDDWARNILTAALASDLPKVVDADALNLIADGTVAAKFDDRVVITPHPGEAARLLNESTKVLQQDRFATVRLLQQRYGAVALLKGAGSLVASESNVQVITAGNPGMASGGSGDVLSGIIGAFIAQGQRSADAAVLGCYVHAAAADIAAEEGERGMAASDIIAKLRSVVNPQRR